MTKNKTSAKMKRKVSETPWGTEIELLGDNDQPIAKGTLEQKCYKDYGPATFGPVLQQPDGGTLTLNLSDEVFVTEAGIQRAERAWELEMARFKADFGLLPWQDVYELAQRFQDDYEVRVNR